LIKWCALPYDQITWESETILYHYCEELDDKISDFDRWNQLPNQRDSQFFNNYWPVGKRPPASSWKKVEESKEYKDGNTLRPYQLEGLNWLLYCWFHRQSSIIADEMGLGK
jgi:chromodomain-helicase-DNA-binding protein 9